MKNKPLILSPEVTRKTQAGFSLLELLIVMIIIAIMSSIAVMYLYAYQKPYRPIDQSLRITDLMQEAKQRALTQRESIRVEYNQTTKLLRIIDENTPVTANDDTVVRSLVLKDDNEVRMGPRPSNITVAPPEPMTIPTATLAPSVYNGGPGNSLSSMGNNVWTIRFQSDGRVLDAGTNATGSNANINSSMLYIWQPKTSNPNESTISLGLSIVGTTGAMRLWEWDPSEPGTNKWQNSRRTSNW